MADSDREKELKAFDDTKLGVKGLVDAGITKIPRIFHHPPDNFKKASDLGYKDYTIPVIDLASIREDLRERERVVERIKEASETWGFFQIVNHGIPVSTLEEMVDGVLRFFEQDSEVKKEFYTRELRPFFYTSNYNLYTTAPTTWKDSFYCNLAPNAPKPEDLPAVCRDILVEYSNEVLKLGTLLFELLSEALGLDPTYLTNIGCTEGLFAFSHYYPACPEPELTMGTAKHSDMDFITVLLQGHIGGLQVFHKDMWIDLPPLTGALVVNIGDFLQLISNDKFKSAQHRVLANPIGPRVSIACFFSTGLNPTSRIYGPIKELLSEDNPAKYREFTVPKFLAHHRTKCLNGTLVAEDADIGKAINNARDADIGKAINPTEDADIGLLSEPEAYESPVFKKYVTQCTPHVATTCSITSRTDLKIESEAILGLCLFDSMERCLVQHEIANVNYRLFRPPSPPPGRGPPIEPIDPIPPWIPSPPIVPRTKLDNHQHLQYYQTLLTETTKFRTVLRRCTHVSAELSHCS
ncbi:1-aminocyclopropane-1-carboxylate oxidase-like 1 [Glycine soja]|uniref:1-aminocyclopropane-1-carboxylate oxidase-like 1 n=1 Tax=Glycine soja TaxID=3848 RepID=A0A445IG24_GLYSO|nr:1-aminocyclopropane-1-carboxylate oxidase-like 1 [Glycine soja]